jgi:hypothetical protein
MDAFDAPSREESCARRNRSNTPQQALVLLNDPTFVEAARVLAERSHSDASDGQGIEQLWQSVLARSPRAEELEVASALLESERARFAADADAVSALLSVGAQPLPEEIAPDELAAWTQLARLVFNLHETVTRS